ncbi:DUF1648 domain-containing protein [Paenibacillus sp. HW567]|uniref:DUF1648 domain-containing protein n=1 Tax=Paenibacillus sp. HW567 TaxID=1034769 RepID=UPI00035D5053|nr:DUF1648 domain-containing protein [Paenibacillus sp. HW567]
MFKSKQTMIISSIAAMIPILLYIYLYPKMPDFVPIHYDGATADRFVNKWSTELLLICLFGWFGFIFIRLLHLLLRKLFLKSYIQDLALISRIWNAATLLVTVGFSAISVYALLAMV